MYAVDSNSLHVFQQSLLGNWSNEGVPTTESGLPYSYNVMPLPQVSPQPPDPYRGYILKNFRYTEEISFHPPVTPGDPVTIAPPAAAPNRGRNERQVPTALFYDQVVRFAEGPAVNEIVHVENGAWLHLQMQPVANGPYPTNPDPNDPDASTYAKQITVPHGNSVLALGNYYGHQTGNPEIPYASGLPTEVDVRRYHEHLSSNADYENPNLGYTADPNKPLREAIEALAHSHHTNLADIHYLHVHFSTRIEWSAQHGHVTNIPFETRMAEASDYEADYWLLSFGNANQYDYLAYTQNITLKLLIGEVRYAFPHVTANVLKRRH